MKNGILIHPEELTKKQIDRVKALGITTLSLHPRGGEKAHETLTEMLSMLKTAEYKLLIDYARGLGIEIEYEFHAASYLLPRELFETHPDYFRMDENGNRTADLNFCVSNEEALNIVVKRAAELAKKLYESTPNYYFWLDDVKNKSCKCPKCKTLSPSDQQLTVMNSIISELKKSDKNARLAYLAYFECIDSPKTVKPANGIFLEYAPIERDMHKRLSEADADIRDKITALINYFGKDRSKVLEYWLDNSLFSKWKKPPVRFSPDNDLIRDDIKYYLDLGFENITSFACFLGDDYEELYGEADISSFKNI